MSWLEDILLAEIHRETYVAILKSWIPHGKKADFAHKIGITREYLSYLCALDYPTNDKTPAKRLPSPQLTRKIAKALPAPPEVKHSLIENIELAHAQNVRQYYTMREFTARRNVGELLAEIGLGHGKATFGVDLTEVRRAYRAVRDASASLLRKLSLEIYPASYVQTCLYLHDAQCVLDRADDALRYAKLARLVLENTDIYEEGFSKEQVDYLDVNAIRGVGVAYHNLELDRRAQFSYAHARSTSGYQNSPLFWEPLVGRDVLNAMSQTPRYSIREANQIAYKIEKICEKRGDEFTLLLARESWLRCLIQHEKWKLAQRVYQEEIERIPRLPYIGSLHRAFLLKSGAQLSWEMGDMATWQERIGETLKLMHKAGLSHQMRTLKQAYGSNLKSVIDSLGLADG
ncbi:MAG: hypothetical protein A2W35_02605 [Chloroflexi bacterium RBG_16_57_11]|nr:MAG: hypothetical protein A2W35_02605 [Chloroflexi bacterium RBG_16_57_11]